MKVVINPAYEHLRDFIAAVPQDAFSVEKVFCANRNTVTKTVYDKKEYVVKKYKRPTLVNCVIYTWFRKSKARRSFEYGNKLLQRGFETATPVAYIEIKRNGFFHTGYYISEYLPYPLLSDTDHLPAEEKRSLASDFIAFTVDLHKHNIVHQDYNQGNILYHKVEGRYRFALIDINRLSFRKTSVRDSMRAFQQLGLQFDYLPAAITKYSTAMNWNVKDSLLALLVIEKWAELRIQCKRQLKSWLPKKKVSLKPA